ncbi:substrate-binding domain-containing protein [Flavisolibacter nicotianae]|uniref:substrate-binding domain-containing protein n=1 Tax=Flavisolibacter nicotianae TaxID=2364882 RepID=UPI000EABA2B4|nr:substrate-binding domain-containing protein [Flavisolibacter nicotianae]
MSAIRQPIERIGKTAMTILFDQLKSTTEIVKSTHQFIPGELIARGSTPRRETHLNQTGKRLLHQ